MPARFLLRTFCTLACALWWLGPALQARAADRPVVFGAIGDFGSDYPSTRAVAKLVKSWNPDFLITLGDNNYPVGAAETLDRNVGQFYHDFIAPYRGGYGMGALTNRFFPSLGNHDWMSHRAQPYFDYFTLPGNERYYTLTRGPVQLFCLDSDKQEPDGCTTNSIQARWLQRELAASTNRWKVVYFHHAPYSSGSYHGTWSGETRDLRWPFHEWGADAVLAGHDHIYERIHTNELVYLVNGLGGDSRDALHYPLVAGSAKQYNADFGALRVDATGNYLLFRFFNAHGALIDMYRLPPVHTGKP